MVNASQEIDTLVAAGHYKAAAELAQRLEKFDLAATLFEQIWEFIPAALCAEKNGDIPRALANALEARDVDRIERYGNVLKTEGNDGKQQALRLFTKHRHFARAAALAEELGNHQSAIALYRKGHQDLHVARLLADQGREHEAGRLLERVINHLDSGPEKCQANLQLGLLLARMMQHDNAVLCLQEAIADEGCRATAQHALILEFVALGLRDSARDVLNSLRKNDDRLPASLDDYISSQDTLLTNATISKDEKIIGGRYRLKQLLGSGASGRVYCAHDQITDRLVALKLLASSHAHGSEAYARFSREVQLATTLRHPNLVETYDVSADQGYLVMEFMQGDSLEERRKMKMQPGAIRRMGLDILDGLELAHQRGIIHRDVKPANIFFDTRGKAKLGDFGVAHLLDFGQTQTGGLIGTLAYMSPEQITGGQLTIAADLYGMGVTLFHVLCHRLPFQGPDFVAQHLGEQPPSPSSVSDCSPDWDPILLRLLEKTPGSRHKSVDELRQQLLALPVNKRPGPLVLPKTTPTATPSLRPKEQIEPRHHPPPTQRVVDQSPRYHFETSIGDTAFSQLFRAIDRVLDRSVIIERFYEPLSDDNESRLYALARGGGPFLQRVLSYDRLRGVAIFEAPMGSPIADLESPLSTRLAVRLFGRLARAVVPLHANQRVHGGLSGDSILLDERGNPTMLVCGVHPTHPLTTNTQTDTHAIMWTVAKSVGHTGDTSSPPAATVVDRLLVKSHPALRTKLLAMPIANGEELYAFAEAIEFQLLEQKQNPHR